MNPLKFLSKARENLSKYYPTATKIQGISSYEDSSSNFFEIRWVKSVYMVIN